MKYSSPTVSEAGLECYEIQTFFILPQRGKTPFFSKNSHLLGDAAYPLKTLIMTPYKVSGYLAEQRKTLLSNYPIIFIPQPEW